MNNIINLKKWTKSENLDFKDNAKNLRNELKYANNIKKRL
jgi:hypothetical protein